MVSLSTSAERCSPESSSGLEGHIEMELWPKELSGLQRSAEVLRETISKVL